MKSESTPPASQTLKKPRKLSDVQKIITKLVSGATSEKDYTFWGRETKFTKNLIKKYGLDFMLWVSPLESYKVSTMLWFYTKLGRAYLSDQLFEYKKANPEQQEKSEIILSEDKIGEDQKIQAQTKPKTLKEFLNYYGEK